MRDRGGSSREIKRGEREGEGESVLSEEAQATVAVTKRR